MDPKELRTLVAGLFARRPPAHPGRRRAGVHRRRPATGAAVPIERVRRAARTTAAAPYVGFEPGGQLELSLPCAPGRGRA